MRVQASSAANVPPPVYPLVAAHPAVTNGRATPRTRAATRGLVVVITLALLVLAVITPHAHAPAQAASHPGSAAVMPGQLILTFLPGTPVTARDSLVASYGGRTVARLAALDAVVATFSPLSEQPDVEATQRLLRQLRQEPAVVAVEPNQIYRLAAIPNDQLQAQQWAWTTIAAYGAWDLTEGSPTVTVAVVDTGVQLDHPDLDGKLLPGYDYVDGDAVPQDGQGHGTHVAGTAAAETNNHTGGAGTCPACRILPVRVLDTSGSGTLSDVAQGIMYAADQGARVINLSFGGAGSLTLERAVNYAWKQGSFLACAAGNEHTSSTELAYPAAYPNCFAVAASTTNDTLASFSNYGTWVDVTAPGTSIVSTTLGSTYGAMSGTSMATPHVAGLAGLLASQGLTNTQIRDRMCATADAIAGTGTAWSCGRINAYRAVGGTAATPPVTDSPASDSPTSPSRLFLPLIISE